MESAPKKEYFFIIFLLFIAYFFAAPFMDRYTLTPTSKDGDIFVAWKIDKKTGEVAVCRYSFPGSPYCTNQ